MISNEYIASPMQHCYKYICGRMRGIIAKTHLILEAIMDGK
jgi:hypothetical protein